MDISLVSWEVKSLALPLDREAWQRLLEPAVEFRIAPLGGDGDRDDVRVHCPHRKEGLDLVVLQDADGIPDRPDEGGVPARVLASGIPGTLRGPRAPHLAHLDAGRAS